MAQLTTPDDLQPVETGFRQLNAAAAALELGKTARNSDANSSTLLTTATMRA